VDLVPPAISVSTSIALCIPVLRRIATPLRAGVPRRPPGTPSERAAAFFPSAWRSIGYGQFKRHQMWKDDWFAFDFGLADAIPGTGSHHVAGGAEPIEDVRIEWVENAVASPRRWETRTDGRTPLGSLS
jgi:hypothetical protein